MKLQRPPVTVPVEFVNGMVSGWRARGRCCNRLLIEAGIPLDLLDRPGARVTASQYVVLFKLLIERFDDECLGFMSRPIKRGSLALMTVRAIGAPTLEGAMQRIARVFRLIHDDVSLEVVRDGNLCSLSLRFSNELVVQHRFLHELLLRVFWRLLAWLAGDALPVARFDFAFEHPAYSSSYGKIFPAELRFGCSESAFWFDAALLSKPVRRDEMAMHAFLAEAQAQVILPSPREDSYLTRVRSHLHQMRPAWPDLSGTANAFHISASTLQRHLAKEGVSYQSLKDELRRDAAITRLTNSKVSLAELASELGFADSAAFQRAFKAWTGSAPGAYRTEH